MPDRFHLQLFLQDDPRQEAFGCLWRNGVGEREAILDHDDAG